MGLLRWERVFSLSPSLSLSIIKCVIEIERFGGTSHACFAGGLMSRVCDASFLAAGSSSSRRRTGSAAVMVIALRLAPVFASAWRLVFPRSFQSQNPEQRGDSFSYYAKLSGWCLAARSSHCADAALVGRSYSLGRHKVYPFAL